MRRLTAVLAVLMLQVGLLAGAAHAGVLDFKDEFNSFDEARWSKGDHVLGRSYLDPANVSVTGGDLALKLPKRTTNGAEIRSNSSLGYGTYETRMKVPNAPSSITGFFLYAAPDYESEIDIEVYNDTSRKVMFSTYAGGKQTHTVTRTLPFDPTTGYHVYRIEYSQSAVKFYAGDVLMQTWTDGIPTASMNLYANSWYPSWLAGKKGSQDKFARLDYISYTQQP